MTANATPFIQKFNTSRINNADGLSFVGELDRLWWDPITNTIRVSDGVTPGGIVVSGGGGGGFGPTNLDGGSAHSTYLVSESISGGAADTIYAPSQVIYGGTASVA